MPDPRRYSTPPQYAAELGVNPEKVLGFIRHGYLVAFDISTTPGIGRDGGFLPRRSLILSGGVRR